MQDDTQDPLTNMPVDQNDDDLDVSAEEQHLDDMFDLSTTLEDYADAEVEETKKMKEELKDMQQADN